MLSFQTVLMQDRAGNNVCVLCAGDGNPKSEANTKLETPQEPPAEVAMKETSSEGLHQSCLTFWNEFFRHYFDY